MGPLHLYDVAVPASTYSCSTYPSCCKFDGEAEPMKTPLPPAISRVMSAVGPAGRACVVVVTEAGGPLLLLLEQAAAPSPATQMIAAAMRNVLRGIVHRRRIVFIRMCTGSPKLSLNS